MGDLPNFAIPEVEVDVVFSVTNPATGATAETTTLYTVQFTDTSNAGKQNTLKCNVIDDASVAGAQPLFDEVTDCQVFNVGGPEWFEASGEEKDLDLTALTSPFASVTAKQTKLLILGATAGPKATAATTYEDFQPCSSKGDCVGATGTCTCNSGHYGEACEKQSTYY